MKKNELTIALDVSQMVYTGTGVGRYVTGLARALLALNSPHHFTLYAGVLRRKLDLERISRTAAFSRAKWKMFPIPPRLASVLFNDLNLPIDPLLGRADIFHTSDWTEPRSRAAKVTTVHDLAFRLHPETVDPLILAAQEKRLKRVVAQGTHIVADSMSTKNDLMKEYDIDSEKIDVVYPGTNSYLAQVDKTAIVRVREKYGLNGKYILSLGTQEPRKNIPRLVDAYNQFHQTKVGSEYTLVLTGRHGWGDKIVGDNRLIKNIGFVDDSELPALYSAAGVFVYPSLYEGFGFPVAEAMSCGTPVVTSNVSSLPEVAGDAGICVDPLSASAIAEGIALAVDRAGELSAKGVKQASKFTWGAAAARTLEVYEKIYRN